MSEEKQPTLTSKNLPTAKPPVLDGVTQQRMKNSVETEANNVTYVEGHATSVVPDEMIEARPLIDPGWSQIKWKNPTLDGRWVNFAAMKGQRFEEACATGYAVAKDTDVDVPGVPFVNGAYRKGDLILMKIPRTTYRGALKYKEELSLQLAGVRKRSNRVRPATRDPRSGEVILPGKRGKLKFFEPQGRDLDELETQEYPDTPRSRSDVLSETIKQMTNS